LASSVAGQPGSAKNWEIELKQAKLPANISIQQRIQSQN
jgi:hypothetical protein